MIFPETMTIVWAGMAILFIIVLILLAVTAVLRKKIRKYEEKHISLKTYLSGKDLDLLLEEYIGSMQIIKNQISECSSRLEKIEKKSRSAVNCIEMVRYSAFEDMGSELSFSIAMLNQDGDGLVLSSINNREETRLYAKPVIAGKSKHNLSSEEREVIHKAQIGDKI
ncbi:MAG TPA: DUF4446 family protein [Desulfitobacteriaceae bacterium]|nr:DUF4446 family protein [Desulfitobacteriaceae bacterium]